MPGIEDYKNLTYYGLWLMCRDENDMEAQYEIASRFDVGHSDVSQDHSKAIEFYQLAASQGHKKAQVQIDIECEKLKKKGNFLGAAHIYDIIAKKAEENGCPEVSQSYMQKVQDLHNQALHAGSKPEMPPKAEKKPPSDHYRSQVANIKGFSNQMTVITLKLICSITHRNKGNKILPKTNLLEGLRTALSSNRLDLDDKTTQAVVIALCQQICNMKKNPIDWRKPRSAKDFQLWLKENQLEDKSLSKIKFDNKKLNELLRDPDNLVPAIAELINDKVSEITKPSASLKVP